MFTIACALICHDKCRHKAASCRPIYPTIIAKVFFGSLMHFDLSLTCHFLEHLSTPWFISTSYAQQAAKDVGFLVSVILCTILFPLFEHTIYTRIYNHTNKTTHMHSPIGSNNPGRRRLHPLFLQQRQQQQQQRFYRASELSFTTTPRYYYYHHHYYNNNLVL